MARYVKLTIVYDMDDETKSLDAELQDWIDGNVGVADFVTGFAEGDYEIVEITQAAAKEWLGQASEQE